MKRQRQQTILSEMLAKFNEATRNPPRRPDLHKTSCGIYSFLTKRPTFKFSPSITHNKGSSGIAEREAYLISFTCSILMCRLSRKVPLNVIPEVAVKTGEKRKKALLLLCRVAGIVLVVNNIFSRRSWSITLLHKRTRSYGVGCLAGGQIIPRSINYFFRISSGRFEISPLTARNDVVAN